ncbi:sugar O-acyltransferase, sialic acid O-acetyltransferase NeuD family [Raineyella antarctica]|uniref:Sugar O-acyltransferase, sialic acid O-acetyltransferase NeuD family n=1 Tax=Raineyella antarctica TaxID=1577474 RepID=A0A1G6HGT1_9ACTN|nr:NeuD/PglB/VioB family sugar acetyltransferase [Raineyella antarctica]SDB93459.1 sugar O-acyltransferase, sialic acid O-acetyltransferase NeuD family [Raineyella antarctica]
MTQILLVAASGLARETMASIRAAGHDRVTGLLDDNPALHGTTIGGVPVLGGAELAADRTEMLLLCPGSGAGRLALASRLAALGVGEDRYAVHVHPSVVVGAGSRVGAGSILLAGCVLTCDVRLGRHVVLMPRTVLTHDDVLADGVTCAAGATVAGRVRIGARTYLGMQASVRQDLTVGEDAVIGMGAVVLRDVPAAQTWAGNPAAPLAKAVRRPAPIHENPAASQTEGVA